MGGNLSLVVSSLGTGYEIDTRGQMCIRDRYKGMRLYDQPLTRDDYGRALKAWRLERTRRLQEAEA